jgi:hypothetical protein
MNPHGRARSLQRAPMIFHRNASDALRFCDTHSGIYIELYENCKARFCCELKPQS